MQLHRLDYVLLGLLCCAAAIVLGKDISVGGLRYGDEAVHAMDGVLIHDWIAAGPSAWGEPVRFAEHQYAHYPTMGIGRDYPPGFALVEAVFFGLFGISAWVSRLTVIFFGLFALSGTYIFVRSLSDTCTAGLAGVALIAMPAVVEWGRQTMLELPTLAILIWSGVAFLSFLRKPTWPRFARVHLAILAAVLLKQTAVFAFSAVALALFAGALCRRVRPSAAMSAVLIAAGMTALVALSLGGHAAQLLRGNATYADRWSWVVLTGYLQIVPDQVGWPLLACAAIGLVTGWRERAAPWTLLVCWWVTCYCMLTAADFKYNRYLFVGLFPFAVWGAFGAADLLRRIPFPRLRTGAAIAAVLLACANAWAVPIRHRPDYGSVVQAHRAHIEGRAVLFSGLREGDFVFAVRQHLPWRCAIVVRSSKLLYSCNGRPNLGFVPSIAAPAEVAPLLLRFAFDYIFVERANRVGVAQEDWLRNFLAESDAYRLIDSHALQAEGHPGHRDVTIDVYELAQATQRSVDYLDVAIAREGRTLRIPLSPATSVDIPAGSDR